MRKILSTLKATTGIVLLVACLGTVLAAANSNDKDSNKSSTPSKTQNVWKTASSKTPLKRETLPILSSKAGTGGKSSESLRTAAQSLFGYNGLQGGNGGGFNNGYNNGFGGQFGFSPNYAGGGAGGRGGGFNQYAQLGNAYNVLDQSQFGGQGQNPYYSNNYFGAAGGGFNGYPYQSTGGFGGGGAYPFANQQGGFGFGGFGQQGFYPGGAQFQGQVGQRNYGFVNQGFGNPAFRNPQGGTVSSSSGSFSSIPTNVQVGTGLEVGSRGFNGNSGGFPSASGQQYIVGNGIGQPAFIGAAAQPASGFGFGGPYGGMYSGGIPGGIYRQQGFGGPYDYPRSLSSSPSPSSSITSRPSSAATRLQTSGPNRFYQGVGPAGTYSPSSRERLYRFTASNES